MSGEHRGRVDGMNSGKNGGRTCWALTGTLCGGKVQGTFAAKVANCMGCDFYKLVSQKKAATTRVARRSWRNWRG